MDILSNGDSGPKEENCGIGASVERGGRFVSKNKSHITKTFAE